MRRVLFFLIFILFIPSLFPGKSELEKIYTNAEANNYLLPLDGVPKKHLLIEVPNHFKYAFYDGKPDQITIQFIPKSDKLKKWSEIITILVLPPSDEFDLTIQSFLDGFRDQKADIHFCNKEPVRTAIFDYELPDSRGKQHHKEVYHVKSYHGEDAIYLIHYGFRYGPDKDFFHLKKKASFFLDHLKIVDL